MLNDEDIKEYHKWINQKRNEINPITGEKNLYKDITDHDVWEAAQKKIKEKLRIQENIISDLLDLTEECKGYGCMESSKFNLIIQKVKGLKNDRKYK